MMDTAKTKKQLIAELEEIRWQRAVEQAAEQVREAVLAMRDSADLMDVVGVMHRSLHQLGVEPFSTSIHFVDEAEEQFQHYLAIRDLEPYGFELSAPEGGVLQAPTKSIEGGWRVRWVRTSSEGRLAVWRAGRITTKVENFEPERFRQVGATFYAPDPDKADWSVPIRGEVDYTQVPFKYGVVTFTVPTVSGAHLTTVQALSEALSLGYMRFLDFQRLEEQNRQILDATQRKSQFLASMSHELRTPMNAIKGFTNLVIRRSGDVLPNQQRENLEKVTQASDHLLAMINDLLDLSKIEAGRMNVNPEPFDMKALVIYCCATVSPLLEEKPNVNLEQGVADEIDQANTDQGRIRQMLINLLSNAIKFTDSGSVTVQVKQENDQFVLSVSDTGQGIPEDELSTIFDEYRQVKGSDREHRGTGLGLSITKQFSELLGGTIGVESEVGKGSTFTVRIPRQYESLSGSG
jgi:nitrogen-specific signal transduction histidine kinase